ncbi:hypothetical protein J5N97_009156 [Dioscorea zingiberensis]|uniref:Ubiquitin carboxyl-terminal hydrolase n=1 Tax=Dioscorea zingiberensis TaxID=325984 RepID=A0A9D5CWB9_9LILI|nr:hypothetical protein J5N97_009156 [Dioscorea zingiberensis]
MNTRLNARHQKDSTRLNLNQSAEAVLRQLEFEDGLSQDEDFQNWGLVTKKKSKKKKARGGVGVSNSNKRAAAAYNEDDDIGVFRQQPIRGLSNPGNLCFMNATLQALISCSPFVELLHQLTQCDIPKDSRRLNLNQSAETVLRHLEFGDYDTDDFEDGLSQDEDFQNWNLVTKKKSKKKKKKAGGGGRGGVSNSDKRAAAAYNEDYDIGVFRQHLIRGLSNPGNLCFMNATLQALLSCSPFVELLHQLRQCDIPKDDYPTLYAFASFISKFDTPNDGRSFCASMFRPVLDKFTPDVTTGPSGGRPSQEDAQELLSFLMYEMHEELLKMRGFLHQTKMCPLRNPDSVIVQPFLLLHLEIHPETVRTIEDALQLFSASETLEGYKTSTGKVQADEVAASRSVKIQELPPILMLHLMRFGYGCNGTTKLNKAVSYPLELVVGDELLADPTLEGRHYELVATITHRGQGPLRGHYTADVKQSDGRWVRCDDASITTIGTNQVLDEEVYVLFYKQRQVVDYK